MTRPRRNQLLYVGFLFLFGWLGVALPDAAGWALSVSLLAVLAAVGWVGRQLFYARLLMRQRKYVEAAQALQRFEAEQESSGFRRLVGVLIAGRYTPNAVAVAENDLGAIASENGRHDVAKKHFERALALDPLYAIPHVNLALLAASAKDGPAAQAAAEKAKALGFSARGLQRALDAIAARS